MSLDSTSLAVPTAPPNRWLELTDIEMRMIADDASLELLQARRDFLLVQEDEFTADTTVCADTTQPSADGVHSLQTPTALSFSTSQLSLASSSSSSDLAVDLDEIKSVVDTAYEASSQIACWKQIDRIEALPSSAYGDSELSLWSAVVSDYRSALVKVPKYIKTMVWSGVPPALRGQVWRAMANASSPTLESLYDSLAAESTHFAKIIGRDLHRTFPEIALFRDRDGSGQAKLGRVMRAYSAYDLQVGYCQGLTFLTGPLLLHMGDRDAFCVLVRLMEDYSLRSMFTADMAGLPLRIFQFESLLTSMLPELEAHFRNLGVDAIYASQWFLSFFAVTCPLHMLVRIYDLVFCEGAVPTLMRTALAVLKRNQGLLLEFEDNEPILEHLLGKGVWNVYAESGVDVLISDITSFDGAAILDGLERSELEYEADKKLARTKSMRNKMGNSGRPEMTRLARAKMAIMGARIPQLRTAKPDTGDVKRRTSKSSNSSYVSDTTLAIGNYPRSDSSSSICTDGDDDVRLSVLSGEDQVDDAGKFDGSVSLDQYRGILEELARVQQALDLERAERQVDREIVSELLSSVPTETTASNDAFSTSAKHLRQRLCISAEDEERCRNEDQCSNCERLMLDLANSRAREAMARQELDQLDYELNQARHLKPAEAKKWAIW